MNSPLGLAMHGMELLRTEHRLRQPPRTRLNPLSRLAAVMALCTIGLLPVEYRGGADLPHAHSAFQLWFDAARGAIDHHSHTTSQAPDDAGRFWHPTGEIGFAPATADGARVSFPTPPVDETSLMPLAVSFALLLLLLVSRPVWAQPGAIAGSAPRPDTPPPRSVALPGYA